MRRALAIITFLAVVGGCGPDYPNDAIHRAAKSDQDCIDCHVLSYEPESEDAPELPQSHWENGTLEKDKCQDCHRKK